MMRQMSEPFLNAQVDANHGDVRYPAMNATTKTYDVAAPTATLAARSGLNP